MFTLLRKFLILLESCLPIMKDSILFSSFRGLYNDNPKAISILLHNKMPEIKQYFVMSDSHNDSVPPYVVPIRENSLKKIKMISRAQVVIDNHSGIRCKKFDSDKKVSLLDKFYYRKRKRQLNISTWHGTPLKHIAADEPKCSEKTTFLSSSDYLLAGCNITYNGLESGFRKIIPIKMYGTPRNDRLITDSFADVGSLKLKLGIPVEKRVILFAPTFRNNVEMSGVNQIDEIEFNILFSTLSNKFGGDWCFVFRVHNLVEDKINVALLEQDNQGRIINGNLHDDMLEYLICSDILLTDYSGSMFDFALTKKPVFLYTPDLEEYANEERGFYVSIDSLPFSVSKSFQELILSIEIFDNESYHIRIDEYLKSIGNIEDGNASMRVVNDIQQFILSSEKKQP